VHIDNTLKIQAGLVDLQYEIDGEPTPTSFMGFEFDDGCAWHSDGVSLVQTKVRACSRLNAYQLHTYFDVRTVFPDDLHGAGLCRGLYYSCTRTDQRSRLCARYRTTNSSSHIQTGGLTAKAPTKCSPRRFCNASPTYRLIAPHLQIQHATTLLLEMRDTTSRHRVAQAPLEF
jgi:hypothetical protein